MNTSTALGIYQLVQRRLAIPVLRRSSPRLRDGLSQRLLQPPLPAARIWLQAASAGEAYLALELARALFEGGVGPLLCTTNTRQGYDILADLGAEYGLTPAYCPFDSPDLMARALKMIDPGAVVLLETELWPGLLASAKTRGTPVLSVNARMSPRSLSHYSLAKGLLADIGPDAVLAISEADAARYRALFPDADVETMPNIKFDRLDTSSPPSPNKAADAVPADTPLAVIGSARSAEAPQLRRALEILLAEHPLAVAGVFPRHVHGRHPQSWLRVLAGMPVRLRSEMHGPAGPGEIILWDVFGQLGHAYHLSSTAFVGGSLIPKGGQNFLEPLAAGVVPHIGPHWSNFAWVGEELFRDGLARRVSDGEELGREMAAALHSPPPKEEIRRDFAEYVDARRGGARQAAARIMSRLDTVARKRDMT
ncbi:3-deoxy-D-manno-octulosonic acid transferase [Desulfohalovibrio reitneri]|uniref:3-deoxy-D-manno-octulosonic acid transferase n=1 Tax=Desulfohalovibrio reitneri TaxID=1307759 RepID=UPI00068D3E8B|nr:glycosyltransferase N-terminal domain-containing protein [Desulfohalovibrio reitneri]